MTETAPAPLRFDDIRRYAELVTDRYRVVDVGGRIDVDQLVAALHGRVVKERSDTALTVKGPGMFTVHLQLFTSARRDRFAVAHELGHYFVHYIHPGRQGLAIFTRGGSNVCETQANVFAASLLMPERPFREAFHTHAGSRWALSARFGVSPAAADARAHVLQLH